MFWKQIQLHKSAKIVSKPWQNSPYYGDAEKWIHIFWNQDTIFNKMFSRLDLTKTVELAVGHGRHSEIVAPKAKKLVVMDVFDENLDVCRKRLQRFTNISYKKCGGFAFDGIEKDWASSIFCYDAMVHFSPDLVESYLNDSHRILNKGGRALFHHSNYKSGHNKHYGLNPHARNHMTKELFAKLCKKAKMNVLDSKIINWGEVDGLDCVTLVEK
jgi:ubiquinone/menaquinone biosynthesis C-methylase UbiE